MTSLIPSKTLRPVDGLIFGEKAKEAEISNKGFVGLLNDRFTFRNFNGLEMQLNAIT